MIGEKEIICPKCSSKKIRMMWEAPDKRRQYACGVCSHQWSVDASRGIEREGVNMTKNWPRDPEPYMLEQIKDLEALDTNNLNDETVMAWMNLYTRLHQNKTYATIWIKTGDGKDHRIFVNVDKCSLLRVYQTGLEVYIRNGMLSLMMGKFYDESDVRKLGELLNLKGDEIIATFRIREEDLMLEQRADTGGNTAWFTFRVINYSDLHLPKAEPFTVDKAKAVLHSLDNAIIGIKEKINQTTDLKETQLLAQSLETTIKSFESAKASYEVIMKVTEPQGG